MPIFELTSDTIRPLRPTTFAQMQLRERDDLQRLLRESIDVVAPGLLVIAEEFGDWDDSRRRIDLLAVDRDANLVVIELKRTEDGGHMDLQAIRYAAMVSTMTFDKAVNAFSRYLASIGRPDLDAATELLDFLDWAEPDEDAFAQGVQIVLVSANFHPELTTAALWLGKQGVDIRCVRLQPYDMDGKVLVDVQQIIPLPEAAEYQVQLREKARKEREARSGGADHSRFDITLGDRRFEAEPKRRAIYLAFRYLAEQGIAPEHIASHCGPRANRALVSVEGEANRYEFIRLASEARAAEGRRFDPKRYYCDDADLLVRDGRTYAFSNQWGGDDWIAAMTNLREAFRIRPSNFRRPGKPPAERPHPIGSPGTRGRSAFPRRLCR